MGTAETATAVDAAGTVAGTAASDLDATRTGAPEGVRTEASAPDLAPDDTQVSLPSLEAVATETPATFDVLDEVGTFLHGKSVDSGAALQLRALPQHLQRLVMERGELPAENPSAELIARVRDAEEDEPGKVAEAVAIVS